ncbi:salicylate synthase [Amycolatopsis sp. NPDC059090]|uniref:salicylate synthase n=1 Tax=Amycolatopsis sp. NPDC059090 TaxID=3346723 RepID=UPI00366F50F0
MGRTPNVNYVETRVPLTGDPLTAVARLAAAGLAETYVVYESGDEYAFAAGAVTEITLGRKGVTLSTAAGAEFEPWNDQPLRQVEDSLQRMPVSGWRAYGWAAFELSYAMATGRAQAGDSPLLHLAVPSIEVRIAHEVAWVRVVSADLIGAVLKILDAPDDAVVGMPVPLDISTPGALEYRQAVADAVARIGSSELQKVILSRVVAIAQPIDLVGTYLTGRRANAPARSFLLRQGGIEATGFSPEVVVVVTADGRITSQPLAGTRALTGDRTEDQRLRSDLLSDPKEIYEHAISVQIATSELAAVSLPGTVRVEEFMKVRDRGSVQHLASRVTSQLASDRTAWDALGAVFPAVTASGVPKPAAYDAIRAHEREPRGLYSGTVLTVDHTGAMDAALVLRSVFRQGGRTWLRAGAGIVGQSNPERELEETCEKLSSISRFLIPAERTCPECL